jgi:hypothetical protein
MKRTIFRAALSFLAVLITLYLGNALVVHFRHPPYSTVKVQHYFLIKQKNNKYEVQYDRALDQTCANSLFPHSGNPPCWYLRRHTEQQTEI